MRALPCCAALAAALVLPASASAAELSFGPFTCAKSGADVPVRGSGFAPNTPVSIGGGFVGESVTTDATGSFTAVAVAPSVSGFSPVTRTLRVSDGTTSVDRTLPVIQDLLLSNAPLSGRLSQTVTWRFVGFAPGRPIYGHFRQGGRTRRSFRFGVAAGPCGALTVRAKRLPTRSRAGRWTLQLDQARSYKATRKPRRTITFTVI